MTKHRCPKCWGDGSEVIGDGTHGGTEQQACSACGGTGAITNVLCAACLPDDQAAVGLLTMQACHGCGEVRWTRRYEPRCEAVHPVRDIRCGLWHCHTEFLEDHCRVLNRSGLFQDATQELQPADEVTYLWKHGPRLDRVTWDRRPHPLDRVLAGVL